MYLFREEAKIKTILRCFKDLFKDNIKTEIKQILRKILSTAGPKCFGLIKIFYVRPNIDSGAPHGVRSVRPVRPRSYLDFVK